jgi:hypothetical protein
VPSDWYPDPTGRFEYRYYNGAAWTADVSRGGFRYVDPLVTASAATDASKASAPAHHDRLAATAMILGIVALSLAWVPFLFAVGAVAAVLAVAFGVVARRRVPADTRGFAGVGIITGVAGLLLVALGVWTTTRVVNVIDDYENPPPHRATITRCAVTGGMLGVAGTIENLGDETSDFRVAVEIPLGLIQQQERVFEVDDVAPGEVATFRTEVPTSQLADDAECVITDVTGPLPFGVDVG